MNYEEEVKKVYPNAAAKHWAYDNGHGVSSFWSVAKEYIGLNYSPDRYISGQMKTQKGAWENAYKNIKALIK